MTKTSKIMTRTASIRSISPKRTFFASVRQPSRAYYGHEKPGLPVRIPRPALLPTHRLANGAPVVGGLAFALGTLSRPLKRLPCLVLRVLRELY